jgi:hypothetical protein
MADEVKAAPEQLTKTQALRKSIERLGEGAMPVALVAAVKKEFGMDVTPKHASSVRSEFYAAKKSVAKEPAASKPVAKKPAPKKPKAAKAVAAMPPAREAPAPSLNGRGPAIRLEDILAVQTLVGRVGAGQLRTLIGMFEKQVGPWGEPK